MNDEYYKAIGIVTVGFLLLAVGLFILYWVAVIVYGAYKIIRHKNFVAYHIFKDTSETEHLRDWYYHIRKRMTLQEFDKLNRKAGRYIAKYRLKNIKATS